MRRKLLVVLVAIFALLPLFNIAVLTQPVNAQFSISEMNPGVPLSNLERIECSASPEGFGFPARMNLTFRLRGGNTVSDIHVHVGWSTGFQNPPTNDQLRQACPNAINGLVSSLGGVQIDSSTDDGWDDIFGSFWTFQISPSEGTVIDNNWLSVSSIDWTSTLAGCVHNQTTCSIQFQSNLNIRAVGNLQLGPNARGITDFTQTGGTGAISGANTLSMTNFRVDSSAANVVLEVCITESPTTCFSTDITNTVEEWAPPPGGDDSEGAVEVITCEIGRFGWAICGLVETANRLLGQIYESVLDQMLRVPAALLTTDSGTYGAWRTFRDIANIVFIILFLFVIFSQVSGIGISNYGIKKVLPKLLVAAVLINLSFFITQAAVDISNIIGHQGNALLKGIAETIPVVDAGGGSDPGGFFTGFVEIIGPLIGVTLVGFAFMTASGGLGGVAAIFIMMIVSGLISVAFLFVVLIFRQVAVVLLVVLSPVAFAAMLLPNTEKMFSSWWRAFKAMLVVYPVAGLLMGGGVLAGRVIALSGGGSTLFGVIAAAATILPFFLVITVTKTALLGLGMVGGALTGKMNQLGGAVGGAAKKP
ncbi:hypothetical protein FWH13_03760, partial [Candidatus Saccharibacteria bacterium]|nr:hypothetical protein [Candidatus Saccharibacteria bacterium]